MNVLDFYNKEKAAVYDIWNKELNLLSSDILFGLTYEFIKPDQILLDLGIGTGISSLSFHKAGLKIYGIEGSVEMLKVCESRGIAVEVKHHDMEKTPFPYKDSFSDYVISTDVFQHFKELSSLFEEAFRILKTKGIFAFTTEDAKGDGVSEFLWNNDSGEKTLTLYRHSESYIRKLLHKKGFALIKTAKYFGAEEGGEHILYKAYIAGKTS